MSTRKSAKLLSCFLAILIVISAFSPAVWAQEEKDNKSSLEWESFMSSLRDLERYATTFAALNNQDANGLVINYIRTGVEDYSDDNWSVLAGPENTEFTNYVAGQDTANGTNASSLRDLEVFTAPNGQDVEFGHMFGALDIAYYNHGATSSADFGSWAGDICDLMEYTQGKLESTDIEKMAEEIRLNYLGVDDDNAHSFGYLDIYAIWMQTI